MVYVKNMDGTPLYPCTNARARILLKQGKAKVTDKQNFTIKLNYFVEFTNNKELILKVDTGSSNVGVAVCDEQGDVYFMGQVTLRNDIKKNMDQRRMYRRNRRNRKTRYRKPRFLNRGNSIRKGRLNPTMTSKLNSHIKIIEYVKTILPITQMVFETTDFDIHAIDHPEVVINGGKSYQESRIDGLENVKAYVRYRDGFKCQNPKCPNKTQKNIRLEVHHKIPRSNGGSNKPDNLITLCEHCHNGIHNGTVDVKFSKKKIVSSKGATQTNIISNVLIKKYPNAKETFGYVTKVNRRRLGLEKEHYFDAVAIVNNNDNIKFRTNEVILFRCIADGDYQLSKGIRSEQRINVGKIHGFRKFDKVLYQNKVYFIKGRRQTGYFELMDIYGVNPNLKPSPKVKLIKRLSARKTWLITKILITI